jgi:hypothetical protein
MLVIAATQALTLPPSPRLSESEDRHEQRLYASETGGRMGRTLPSHPRMGICEEDGYVGQCVKCAVWGPKRESYEEAKLAFDEVWGTKA